MSTLNQNISTLIETQRDALAIAIVDRQWQLYPELDKKYGEIGHAKCVQDVKYNLAYLSEAIAADSPTLFAEYIAWIKVLFAGLNIPDRDLAHSLEITGTIMQQKLSPEMATVVGTYLDMGLKQLPHMPSAAPSFINDQQPLALLAQQYLTALLKGERQLASRLILEAVDGGESIKDIYLHVFQRSQHEIGRLWQTNQISVAQEHYCTAATQMIMSQLYPHIFTTDKINRRLVATCIDGELHEIGVRMVADFFEIEGWDTYYLGANTPTASIIQTIIEQKAEILAISATMTFHVSKTVALIEQVREFEIGQQVKILVGGYPFNLDPELWRKVGAAGYAQNAQSAVDEANRLVENGV